MASLLPAPTVQSHAANLMELPGGDLGCVWFGGTQEGVADISIWMSRRHGDGWGEPVRLSDDGERSEQNPVLFPTPSGDLWLLYTAQHAGDQDTAVVRRRISSDGGASWGPASTLFSGGVFVRQPVVVLPSGRWLVPVFRCVKPAEGPWMGDLDTSAVMVSDDAGNSWRSVEVPGSTGCVHMNVVAGEGGSLVAFFRSRWADFVYTSRSGDSGDSWSVPVPTSLPNNNSSIQCVRLADGRLALVYNHSSRVDATERRVSLYDEISSTGLTAPPPTVDEARGGAFWGAPRAPMSLAFSADDGRTWTDRRDLETGDGYCLTNNSRDGLNRELSYPSIRAAADGSLHIAYTHFRQAIKYVRVPA